MLTQSIQTLGADPFATILQDDHGTINLTRVDESVRFGPIRIDRYHSICHRPIHPHRAAVIELGINNVFEEAAKAMEAGFPTTLGGVGMFYKLLTHSPFF